MPIVITILKKVIEVYNKIASEIFGKSNYTFVIETFRLLQNY